jgi:conjugal transfer mating pair stabilization protein TraG
MADLTVVTYGGGEILRNIFNAIAMLMGKGGIIWPIAIMTASIGGIWAVSKAFFSSGADILLTHYILPLMAIPCFLMVPTASVKIEDVLKNESYKVDHVPLFLAKVTELISTIGYKLTQGMETVMHTPDDLSYNKTGMLFGAETALDISKYKVTNATLEQNLHKFARQCIVHDLALGRYSLNDLKKTTDLWSFLKENTSKVRMIHYFDPSDSRRGGEYLSCANSLAKIEKLFAKEKAYYSQHELLKHLPMTFQALTGMQKESEELIGQQIMISNLSSGLASANFAKMRAEAQQKSTYKVMGSIASSSLINMRVVLEALIYGSFLIVIPLALIPGGIKFIFSWLWLCVWIQLWPPFYAILNYIMQIAAKNYAKTLMYGLSSHEIGLSLFTSEGLLNLHENVAALTGYLALSIPFISYTILQGAQSFVHLVGTLAAPAQSAATSSATEQTTANYSYANSNIGQMSYQNTSALQSNTAPSLSSGFSAEHHGSYSAIHARDGTSVINQHNSNLKSSLFSDEAISESLHHSLQSAETHVASTQQNYAESLSKSARAMEDFTTHVGASSSYSENSSERVGTSIQESSGYLKNTVENFAKQHGINTSQGYDAIVAASVSGSGGISLLGNGLYASTSTNHNCSNLVSSSDALSAASNITSSEDFQKHFNNLTEYAKNDAHSSLSDEGTRLASGLTESLDQAKSSQESHQNALSAMNQASQNLSWSQSNSHQIKRSLNQDFVDWSVEKIGYQKTVEMLEDRSPIEREQMMSAFLSDYVVNLREGNPSNYTLEGYQDPKAAFAKGDLGSVSYEKELAAMKAISSKRAESHGLKQDVNGTRRETLDLRFDLFSAQASRQFNSSEASHAAEHANMKSDFEEKKSENRFSRMCGEVFTGDQLSSRYQPKSNAVNPILWLQE